MLQWVADGSPTHSSTPVKIENALQFVPKNTNPKEFKQLQQQIKDYRRADKISAGPQSHILEGVTWEEAKKMQDATVTQTGDQVVLMGAASKGIIQRGFQHNATMYKSPYAKNPFDSVTDEELDEYKRVVERKARGDFDDTTDYSESEGLSSAQINKRISDIRSPTSVTSETEEESRDEPQVLRIETTQAPKPSQPEIVMSDDDVFLDNPQEIIVQQLKVAAVEQSPVSRVSINSSRSMKVVRAYKKPAGVRNYYRTTSFSGFPKGSYLLPNPRHFHVAHYTNINRPMRPQIINLISGGRYSSFNPNVPHISHNWSNSVRPTVTINTIGVIASDQQ
ncbi:hypothetical protein QE152_g23029 [Popillia japonica]|uniref:Uncharacterized protein n=1 Tax=Popillia japonica TaxID=7064 RepID=A0AAW1KIG9_POPJA